MPHFSIRKLGDIPGVIITSAAADEVLSFDGTDWVNAAAAGGGGFTIAFKTANETINNDNTLTDDADMKFTADANGVYFILLFVNYQSDVSEDFKYAFSFPAGGADVDDRMTGNSWNPMGNNTMGKWTASVSTASASTVATGLQTWGVFVNGATAGTFNFQWAQRLSGAADTILRKGSSLIFKKLN